MTTITRDESIKLNLKFYFTGVPCKHGHISNRYTSNNICVDCQSRSNQRHWRENSDQLAEQHRQRLEDHRDRYNHTRRMKYKEDVEFRNTIKQRAKQWYDANRDLILADADRKLRQREYRQLNQDQLAMYHKSWRSNNRQSVNHQSRTFQQLNRPYYNAKQAAYRAQKRSATPPWCEHAAIIRIYAESRRLSEETGIPHEVDHIIPIVNPKVCGLHCLANLRIITSTENKTKNNKFDVD